MDNFLIARVRLTGWYLIIVLLVSTVFSTIIYTDLATELNRSFETVSLSIQTQPFVPGRNVLMDKLYQDLEKAKRVVFLRLLVVNGFIVLATGIAGYILAGKSLKPIEEAVKKQKQFIADASHELKTPLTVLRSETEVALKQKMITTKQSKHILKSNLEEVIKMQNLTNYLLLLSRYSETNSNLKFETVDLKKTIINTIAKHKSQLKSKKIRLETDISDIKINANETSISELISILLDNAIKYSPNNKKIIINAKQKRGNILITITDHGMGIRQSDIPYIFNRFYRSDISRNSDGHGLGLAIAKSIVDMHHGTIEVDSKIGKVTSFRVVLPKGVI